MFGLQGRSNRVSEGLSDKSPRNYGIKKERNIKHWCSELVYWNLLDEELSSILLDDVHR